MYYSIQNYFNCVVHPKDLNFIALNKEGDILEIANGDENAKAKLISFFKRIHEINKFVISLLASFTSIKYFRICTISMDM